MAKQKASTTHTPNLLEQILTNAPIIAVTILAAALFALSRGAYNVFYHHYGVSPSELGLDYVTILTQQAFSIATLLLVVLVLVLPLIYSYLVWYGPRGYYRRTAREKIPFTVTPGGRLSVFIAVGVVASWVALMFLQASISSPGPYYPPFSVAPLQAEVQRVTPHWLLNGNRGLGARISWSDIYGEDCAFPGQDAADSKKRDLSRPKKDCSGFPDFLLLGRSSGLVVLYERSKGLVVRLPADRIALI